MIFIGFLSLLCLLLIVANVILVWYIRRTFDKLRFISDNVGSITKSVDDLILHLDEIYKLDMFNGEPILEDLMSHTKYVYEDLNAFKSGFSTEEESDIEQ